MNRSRLLLEHILDLRAGVGEDYVVPSGTTYIDIDHLEQEPAAQAVGGGSPGDDSRFTPLGDSGGVRQPARGSATSYRSWAPVPELDRMVTAESLIERRVRDIILGRSDLVDLRDQWPRVGFMTRQGMLHHHVFDYCARYRNGLVELIAVKPANLVDRPRKDGRPTLKEAVDLIVAQGEHLAYGHKVTVLTDRQVCNAQAQNAKRLREARRYRHEPDVTEARAEMVALGSRFRFHELVRGTPNRWRRVQAIWALIDERELLAEEPGEIVDRSWLRLSRHVVEAA